jgi:hypothetical protein
MSELFQDSSAGMNGSFEYTRNGLPVNWLLYTPNTVPSGDFEIIIDTTEYKNGRQSLKLLVRACSADGGWHSPGFCNEYPAKSGDTYRISFWVKNEGCRFLVQIGGITASLGSYETLVDSQETTLSWQLYQYEYTIPQRMNAIRIEANVLQPGTFWIDDIRIEKINGKTKEMTDSV